MDLQEMQLKYQQEGYAPLLAAAKVCQDVILLCIASSHLKEHATIKGGVVMHSLSHDKRRATQDIDFDFIRYPLSPEAIRSFLAEISNDEFTIVADGKIEALKHQDYQGLRVNVRIEDKQGHSLASKLDVGVHTQLDLLQDDYCFDIDALDENVTLLVNSREQIFVEKMKSFLKHGFRSTRFKDVFDLYFLCQQSGLDEEKLRSCIRTLILDDETMREDSLQSVYDRLARTFQNRNFLQNFKRARKNWLDVSNEEALKGVLDYVVRLI